MPKKSISNMFHISLNVSDLKRSVEFYTKALGTTPTKHHPDYAKFELIDPPLVLSLEPGRGEGQQRLNHLGIRVADSNALRNYAEKVHTNGLEPQYIQGVECCYSRQTKLCLTDPDENLVEFYILEADLEDNAKSKIVPSMANEKTSTASEITWEHLLGTPFPTQIPLANSTANEIKLRGTFNLKRSSQEIELILAEVRRVLCTNGGLMIHLLVSDREITKKLPRLPGPAALVEYTPTEKEVIAALEKSGFCSIYLKRLSHSAVFQFDGAEMRELMLTAAIKSNEVPSLEEHTVVYKGPLKEMVDDFGIRYLRGTRTRVNSRVFSQLNTSGVCENFVFLNSVPPSACVAPIQSSNLEHAKQPGAPLTP